MGAVGYLVDFLRAHDAATAQKAQAALSCVDDLVSTESLELQPKTPVADCRQKVSALSSRLGTLGDIPGADVARDALTNVLQYLDSQAASSLLEEAPLRDRDMAENLEWLATKEYPNAKIALWAHNFHVGTRASSPDYQSMGTYLRKRFGVDYYTIGQTFGSGTVRAVVKGHGLQSVAVLPKPGDSVAALFGPLDAIAFLDLRGLKSGSALRTYFAQERGIEQIGSMATAQGMDGRVQMIVPDAYDGLVYVPTSTAATYGALRSHLQRDTEENGQPWVVAGPGFDDVTISEIASGAALSNSDGLNALPIDLLRRFEATTYAGHTISISGEARRSNLMGYAVPFARAVSANGSFATAVWGSSTIPQAGDAWVRFTLKLSVPSKAEYIEAGISSAGLGSSEVRNVTIDG
jgi:hypothetical protein